MEIECPACGREFACKELKRRPKVTVAAETATGSTVNIVRIITIDSKRLTDFFIIFTEILLS